MVNTTWSLHRNSTDDLFHLWVVHSTASANQDSDEWSSCEAHVKNSISLLCQRLLKEIQHTHLRRCFIPELPSSPLPDSILEAKCAPETLEAKGDSLLAEWRNSIQNTTGSSCLNASSHIECTTNKEEETSDDKTPLNDSVEDCPIPIIDRHTSWNEFSKKMDKLWYGYKKHSTY